MESSSDLVMCFPLLCFLEEIIDTATPTVIYIYLSFLSYTLVFLSQREKSWVCLTTFLHKLQHLFICCVAMSSQIETINAYIDTFMFGLIILSLLALESIFVDFYN